MDLLMSCDGKADHARCLAAISESSIVHAMALSWGKRQEKPVLRNFSAGFQSSRIQHSKTALQFAQLLFILSPADALNELLKDFSKHSRRGDDRSGSITYTDVDSACDLLLRKCKLMQAWLHDAATRLCRLTYEAEPLDDETPLRQTIKTLLLRVLNARRESLHFAHSQQIFRKKLVFVGGENTRTVYAEQYHWDYAAPEMLLDAAQRRLLHFSHSVECIVLMDDVAEHHSELTSCLRDWPTQILLVSNPEQLSADIVIRRLDCELTFDLTAERIHGTKAERRKMKSAIKPAHA